MDNLNRELLSSIDSIEECIVESELNVCVELLNGYAKSTMLMENADESVINEYAIIQEGKIGDFFSSIGKAIKKFFNKLAWAFGSRAGGMFTGIMVGNKIAKAKKQLDKTTKNAKKTLKKMGGQVADGESDFILGDLSNVIKGYTNLGADTIKSVASVIAFVGGEKGTAYAEKLNAIADSSVENESALGGAKELLKECCNLILGDKIKKASNTDEDSEDFEDDTPDEETTSDETTSTKTTSGETTTTSSSAEGPKGLNKGSMKFAADLANISIKMIESLESAISKEKVDPRAAMQALSDFYELATSAMKTIDALMLVLSRMDTSAASTNNVEVFNEKYSELADSAVKKLKPFLPEADGKTVSTTSYNIPQIVKIVTVVSTLNLSGKNLSEGISDMDRCTKSLSSVNTVFKVDTASNKLVSGKSGKTADINELIKMGTENMDKFEATCKEFEAKNLGDSAKEEDRKAFTRASGELSAILAKTMSDAIKVVDGIRKTFNALNGATS